MINTKKKRKKNAEFGNLAKSNSNLQKFDDSNAGATLIPVDANVSYLLPLFPSRLLSQKMVLRIVIIPYVEAYTLHAQFTVLKPACSHL